MSKYQIVITDAETSASANTFVSASGSLKLITLAAKEGLAEIEGRDGEFFARIVETETVDGEEKRSVVRLTAEADIVKTVVTKRLRDEKAQNAADTEAGADRSDVAGEEAAAAL